MATRLEQALPEACALPLAAQDQLAEQILADTEGELRCDATLRNSQDALERLAEQARRARREGSVRRKGFGR